MTIRPGSTSMTKLIAARSSPSSFTFRSKTSRSFLTWRSIFFEPRTLFIRNTAVPGSLYKLLPLNRSLAQVRPEPLSELWFTASFPAKTHRSHAVYNTNNNANENIRFEDEYLQNATRLGPPGSNKDHKPPDERTLKLGKTLRVLSPLLPTIFTTPLPNSLLNASVSLHLFPSTHPHLPVVKSRVPCRAALWTAPMAWGSVPIVGNVRIEVMSEKMVRTGFISAPVSVVENEGVGLGEEKLVVKWKTENRKNGNGNGATPASDSAATSEAQSISSSHNEVNRGLSTLLGGSQPLFSKSPSDPFTGLFIFSFDKDGQIASITIEHSDESQGFDKTSRMVTLTDWLLGKAKWGRVEGSLVPGLAYRGGSDGGIWCKEHANSGGDGRFAWQKKG